MEKFANQTPFQLTLREMLRLSRIPKFWIGFGAVVMVLAISGPFDTQDLLGFAERLVYWAFTGGVTLAIGLFMSYFVSFQLGDLGVPEVPARTAGALLSGIPITVFVWFSNIHLFSFKMDGFFELLVYCCAISGAVVLLFALLEGKNDEENAIPAPVSAETYRSPFLASLPVALGKDLITLQAQDHYLEVVTTKGKELVLMRLADACQGLADYPGLRVHRSWWVAENHIDSLGRNNGKPVLIMKNGSEIPVSRTHLSAVRDRISSLDGVK